MPFKRTPTFSLRATRSLDVLTLGKKYSLTQTLTSVLLTTFLLIGTVKQFKERLGALLGHDDDVKAQESESSCKNSEQGLNVSCNC